MGDFDIEAYLEEQVQGKEKQHEKSEKRSTEDDNDKPSEENENSKVRDRDNDRHRDRERRNSRSRSRSRDRRDDRNRKHRSRSRSIDRRRGRRSRSRSDDRSRRRRSRSADKDKRSVEVKKPAVVDDPDKYQNEFEREQKRLQAQIDAEAARRQQQIDDLTKDQRTIFVGQLTMKVKESNLYDFFTQVGKVKNVIIVRDKVTNKHKGFGYVEMAELSAIPNCLLFHNVVPDFQKFPIIVRPSEAEKNYLARKDTNIYSSNLPEVDRDPRIYVGNIHINIDENSLRTIAEQFGSIESIALQKDENGVSKGFAFIRYMTYESAQMAMAGMSGMELVGRALKVGPVLDAAVKSLNSLQSSHTSSTSDSQNWKLDDDDGTKGMSLNAYSRLQLMAKLGQAAGIQLPTMQMGPSSADVAKANGAQPIIGNPTRAILLSNMFNPKTETGDNWDVEIKEDVLDECSKFGKIEHIYVDKSNPNGLIYLKFTSSEAAQKAANTLNGRFFAGLVISVKYLDPLQYDFVMSGK